MAGNPYLWSTTAASNATADADVNWAEGQLPGTVNGSARGMMAGVAGWLKDTNGSLTTGGSSNAYTVTTNVTYAALAQGLRIVVKANHTNTGASTLVVTPGSGSAFASKAIRAFTSSGDSALSAGMIQSGGHYELEYDTAANGSAGAWILTNAPPQSASESATGVVELATNAETVTGSDTARAVTPANLTAKMSAPGAIGNTTPASGAFTTLSASGLISADGGQIKFPASQAASADANTFDDYERGTFTATLTASPTPPTTPITATGYYQKEARVVHYWIAFSNVDTTGASGSIQITGLPFAVSGAINLSTGGSPMVHSLPVSGPQSWYLAGTTAALYYMTTGAAWSGENISAGAGKYIWCSGSYLT